MMADIYALAMAHPTLASVLFLIVLLVTVLFIAVAIGLRRLPPDTLTEVSEIQALKAEHQAPLSTSRPLPWHRAGGNWWPVP
ncbi:MAG: hypothetical protein RL375_777 [Pseudomonadota bacterium]|jgi:hypothetical protein